MNTLISFLGRKPAGKSYDLASYDFGKGKIKETRFFGLALCEELQPQRLVILGTSGSMWDVLVEALADSGDAEAERLALIDAAEKDAVTQRQLDQLAPLVSRRIGCECQPAIIPYGRDAKEQTTILRIIAESVDEGDTVTLDLTHGLRHLPMLGLLSALYLREARRARIDNIFYGAFDLRKDDVVPVVPLKGLLDVADWIRALAVYDGNGDYSVFSSLLEREGIDGGMLRDAAFYERIFNPEKARQKLTVFPIQTLKEQTVSGLFADAIGQRIDWFRKPSRSGQEKALAWTYFEKNDFVRAVCYAFEAFCTQLVEKQGGNISDFDQRKNAFDLEKNDDETLRTFGNLRNELVHGARTKSKKIQEIADDPSRLESFVHKFLKKYLPRDR